MCTYVRGTETSYVEAVVCIKLTRHADHYFIRQFRDLLVASLESRWFRGYIGISGIDTISHRTGRNVETNKIVDLIDKIFVKQLSGI